MINSIIETFPALYFSVTEDGRLLNVNSKLCEKLGYSEVELKGEKTELIFTVATRIFQQTHLVPLLKMQGFAEEIYITLQTKQKQSLPVIINAERKKVDGEYQTFYAGIIVQTRKKFEDELVAAKKEAQSALHQNTALHQAKDELQENLEQLDRHMQLANKQNEELRQYNKVVTHDLQEPLRKLFMFMDILANNAEETSLIVEKIKKVSAQMRSILSGLQQYVWLTDTRPVLKQTDLNKVLKKASLQVKQEFASINLKLEAEDIPLVEADEEQVGFLFHQLLANAMQFRKGTEVSVKLTASSIMLNKFRNIANKYKYEPFLKLQFADDGTGFDAIYKDQVFELFKKLHPESGRGVGLSLCKKIIENHNGSIAIDSKLNIGTTITLYLPLQRQVNDARQVLEKKIDLS